MYGLYKDMQDEKSLLVQVSYTKANRKHSCEVQYSTPEEKKNI